MEARQGRSAALLDDVFDSTALRSARIAVLDALACEVRVITVAGTAGCGKSILLHMVKDELRRLRQPARLQVAMPGADAAAGLRAILADQEQVLLVDDADGLANGHLRALLALARAPNAGQLVLAGTAELQARVAAFARLPAVRHVRMGPLLRQEIEQFIARRMAKAKTAPVRFEQAALDRAYALSHGVPGSLDKLCTCLLALRKETIEVEDIDRAASLCNMARPASSAATAAPRRARAPQYIAAGVAAAIGISLGAAFLIATVGVPQAAESAAKLIRALHPAVTAAVNAMPTQFAASPTPQEEPAAEPEPPEESPDSIAIETQTDDDAADQMPPDAADAMTSGQQDPPPEVQDDSRPDTASEQERTEPEAEPAVELAIPENEPAPGPTAEELAPPAPTPPAASAPEPAPQPATAAPEPQAPPPAVATPAPTPALEPPPVLAQPAPAPAPPVQSGTADTRGSDRPSEAPAAAPPPPAAPPSTTAAPAAREPAGSVNPATPTAPRPSIDTGPLMARGMALLRERDIAGARLFFEHAAAQGDAAAMLALGRTYDPLELRAIGVLGLKGDPQKALEWYRSAANAGDPAAQGSMGRLSEWIARSR